MLRATISDALKDAMKAKDARRVSTLRMVQAAIKDRDIAARTEGDGGPVADEAILQLLAKLVKQRRDSITAFQQGGREDLVAQEEAEIAVIEGFLPQGLSDADLDAAVRAAIAETGAAAIKDMGRVMAVLKQKHAGAIDLGKANGIAKALLTPGT
ncbi:GatB/YqeY domain-containing protein [Zavarzinia sp. CC-PAN008]|uniref:GatB/YqeY domain-containing protein n=1 Tax=Zavarzinia sp. CC-PAN008 TaxID=3243332 RepID=UPI003F745CE0